MIKSVIAFISVLIIFYLAGCFISVSFNIKNWDGFLRGFMVFTAIGFGGIAYGMVYENKK